MEYKHNTLLEAYDVDDVRLVREGEALRIERVYRRRPALFRGSMPRAVVWAASVSIGIALGAWLVYQVVR